MGRAGGVERLRVAVGAVGALGLAWGLAYTALAPAAAPATDDWRARLGVAALPIAAISGPAHFTMAPPSYTAPGAVLPGRERLRRVLVLFNGHETFTDEDDHGHRWKVNINSENNRFHTLAELALNHAGLVADFHDLNDPAGLPGPAVMAGYRGVAVWTGGDKCRDPEGTLRWYAAQALAGRPVVLFERTGCATDLKGRPIDAQVLSESMAALGLRFGETEIWDSEQLEVAHESGTRTGFEAPLALRLPYFRDVQALDPAARIWLRLRTDGGATADAVVVGPRATYVMREYALRENKIGARWVRAWLVDPFTLFAQAFGMEGEPRLDFTTRTGNRLFYAHIDGDGLETISEIDRKSMCGEIVRDRLVRAFRLPVTASFVTGRIQPPPEAFGTQRAVDVARTIAALPNVEVASHGYSHPMDWRAGEKAELSVANLPGYTLSGEGEIAHSTEYIDAALTTPDKPVRAMLWTGWCNPTEEQLAVAERLGLYNLNGGDPRMDRLYPSYAHLAPPIHRVGRQFQFFTSAANDYILTDDWTPPYYRFGNVVDTFEHSGAPVRVVPMNIYYHFYIGQNLSALEGAKNAYKYAQNHTLSPVFVSEYVDVVKDFYYGRVAEAGPGAWNVRTDGKLLTVRFDGAPVDVDLDASSGVLGYVYEPSLGATYVHLSGPKATVVLGQAPPRRPYLRRSTHAVTRAEGHGRQLSLDVAGYGPKTLEIAGLPPGRPVEVTVFQGGRIAEEPAAAADAEGVAHLHIDGDGAFTVDVGHP